VLALESATASTHTMNSLKLRYDEAAPNKKSIVVP
jgi:hypothetical protein